MSSSCQNLETISSALLFILETKYGIIDLVKVLDDFLFVKKRFLSCERNLNSFFELCRLLGHTCCYGENFRLTLVLVVSILKNIAGYYQTENTTA